MPEPAGIGRQTRQMMFWLNAADLKEQCSNTCYGKDLPCFAKENP